MNQSICFLYNTTENVTWHQRKDEKTLLKIDDLNFIQIWEKESEFGRTPYPYPPKFGAFLPNLKRFLWPFICWVMQILITNTEKIGLAKIEESCVHMIYGKLTKWKLERQKVHEI